MSSDILLAGQLLENGLREDLAQLDAHLVVRVDAPDRALHMDLVLVHGNQGAQCAGGELLEHDRVGGTVALEDLGLDESAVLRRLRAELLDDLLLGLAKRESPVRSAWKLSSHLLRLREEVGEQNLVVLAASDGVQSLDRGDEVTTVSYR